MYLLKEKFRIKFVANGQCQVLPQDDVLPLLIVQYTGTSV